MAYTVRVEETFAAAHRLQALGEGLHGHNYRVVATVRGEPDERGVVVDFRELKRALRAVLPDHAHLNERFDFPPTAENLARHVYEALKPQFPGLVGVRIYESDTACADYEG